MCRSVAIGTARVKERNDQGSLDEQTSDIWEAQVAKFWTSMIQMLLTFSWFSGDWNRIPQSVEHTTAFYTFLTKHSQRPDVAYRCSLTRLMTWQGWRFSLSSRESCGQFANSSTGHRVDALIQITLPSSTFKPFDHEEGFCNGWNRTRFIHY